MSQRFQNIIRHYKKWKSQNPDRCITHCANQRTLPDAIVCAAQSVDENGMKHPHQYRLKRSTLQEFGESMLGQIFAISETSTFDELIQVVRKARVRGIGELAIYDAAVRIGAFKNVWPEKIYLHAGAKVGASSLIHNLSEDIILQEQLPIEFRDSELSCYELEDILCIYKKLFRHASKIGRIN